ncbi:MAG: hypothetical protein MZV64_09210 [Ignavibacteriales bacterium]|nr:hypothetical protein [Ignavibacteriales bacterium]
MTIWSRRAKWNRVVHSRDVPLSRPRSNLRNPSGRCPFFLLSEFAPGPQG